MQDTNTKAGTSQTEAIATADDVSQDVRPYDILCGRSKTCFNNIGNRRFRITIGMNLEKYDNLTNRTERGKFIVSLARTLKEDVGFRFVRISKKTGRVELSDEEVRAKIGHALRDLSKTKAEAAAAAAKPVITEEAKKIMEATKKPPLKVVTPEPQPRRVTNDFETDSKGKPMAFPQVPDIRKEAMMDTRAASETSQTIPTNISFSFQQDLLSVLEGAPQSTTIQSILSDQPMVPSDHGKSSLKPAPVGDASPESGAHKEKEIGDEDYCLMPVSFYEPSTPGILAAIHLDGMSSFTNEHMLSRSRRVMSTPNVMTSKSAMFEMHHEHDDDDLENVPYNDEAAHKMRSSFPLHQQSHDLMSMGSDDDHMISLCESVDCLSLDLDAHT
ncbi:MAG: hypothetical protein SGBAC_012885 [Bacillariaceae sp.]